MGVDIIIVACKSDLLQVDDAVSLKRAKAIQGQLRAIGLLIGAAVVYVSAMTDVNTARLRKYIIHKMYPEAVTEEGGIEVRILSEERRIQSAYDLQS
jgi:Dynein light intermediate chain (DLIC)